MISLIRSIILTAIVTQAFAQEDTSYHTSDWLRSQVKEAQSLMSEKKFSEAEKLWRKLISEIPDLRGAVFELAHSLVSQNQRKEAVSLLKQALSGETVKTKRLEIERKLKLIPRTFVTNETFEVYQSGIVPLQAKHGKLALAQFYKALEKEPTNSEILLRVGQALLLTNDFSGAVEKLKLARSIDESEPEIDLWLGYALMQEKFSNDPTPELKRAHRELPESEQSALWLSQALIAKGERDKAEDLLEDELEKFPMHLACLVGLIKLTMSDPDLTLSHRLASAKKLTQLATSRFEEYAKKNENGGYESELGFNLIDATTMKKEITDLSGEIDQKLK